MKRISYSALEIGDIARKYMKSALDKGWISEGENVKEFERQFASKFGYKHAIATSSGTDACICSCATLYDFGAKRGDEIIVPALTFVATANSVLAAGFIPRFVDIELETLNIDPSKVERAITSKTRAIMPVHLMGKPAKMDEILQIAKTHNLYVIEDACEAHGAKFKGKVVGAIGDMGAFSFYVAHFMTCGEGGMVVTDNDDIAEIVRSVKSHGRPFGKLYFDFQRFGLNSKMNDMEAAIGLEGMWNFSEDFNKRRYNLFRLLDLTKELSDYCFFIREEEHETLSPMAFPIVLKDKKYDAKRLYGYLEDASIECKTLFGSLPTQHRAFSFLDYSYGDFPNAEYVGKNGLQTGIHKYLSDDDLLYVSEILKRYFSDK